MISAEVLRFAEELNRIILTDRYGKERAAAIIAGNELADLTYVPADEEHEYEDDNRFGGTNCGNCYLNRRAVHRKNGRSARSPRA